MKSTVLQYPSRLRVVFGRHPGSKRVAGTMMSKTLSEVLAEELVRGGTLEPALAQPVRPSGVPVKWVDEARARCTESHALEICGQRSTINDVLEHRASRP